MKPQIHIRTPAQLALAAERRAKRQLLSQTPRTSVNPLVRFKAREWIQLHDHPQGSNNLRVKVLTWNLLAQCLVRRDLFPTSTCLRVSERNEMLRRELMSQQCDVLCLQEVDSAETLCPVLEDGGFSHFYASGLWKKHGCIIAWANAKYTKLNSSVVHLDEQTVREGERYNIRRGGSFRTKNVGALVALQTRHDPTRGLLVATTHLFWHPRYNYERARQVGILVREVLKFREAIGRPDWPCVIAGDFNFAPDDAAYSLLMGEPLTPAQELDLEQSRVVHRTIDPSIPKAPDQRADDDEGEDPIKVITEARPAAAADGLLSTRELVALHSHGVVVRSAYEEGQREHRASSTSERLPIFGDRANIPLTRRGAFEPEWTSYAYYWKTVLDYIFILDPPDKRAVVQGFLKPHSTADLEPGLPKRDVCGSDHVLLSAELAWEAKS